ncbi:MAG: hypothetical protein WD078_15455 [Woeseia sp.]
MGLLDYVHVSLAAFSAYALGRLFLETNVYTSFLGGAILLGTIISVTGWWVPGFTKPILITMMLGSLIVFAVKCRSEYRFSLYPIFSFAICLLIFRHFAYQQYHFNNHDPAYWGYAYELLKADYFGPIRIPTLYPEQFAPTHILPSTVVASLAVLIDHITLPKLIEVRYLCVAFVMSGVLTRLIAHSEKKAPFVVALFASFFVFETELGYNFLISSYLYVLIVLEIFVIQKTQSNNKIALLFFSAILVLARAPIAYIAVGLFSYFWLISAKERYEPKILGTCVLVGLAIIPWLVFPPPFSRYCLDLSTSFMNPFNFDELLSIARASQWLMPDTFINFYLQTFEVRDTHELAQAKDVSAAKEGLLIILPLIGYLIVKLYLFPIMTGLSSNGIRPIASQPRPLVTAFGVFGVLSLGGWLFIRNGGMLDHQAHAFLVMSVPAFLFTATFCSMSRGRLGCLIIIAMIYAIPNLSLRLPFDQIFHTGIAKTHLRYNELLVATAGQNISSNRYKPSAETPMWISELRAMFVGSRVFVEDYPDETYEREFFGEDGATTSIMPAWAVSEHLLPDCAAKERKRF